ncbi:DUF4350 domain-containing protein [Fischerella sp. JS2]|uniref:DUF4350 domain-containing protein n=1 Tax=Fischerella sp. JS2 TaxID=2597771 RepID=UPI0028E21E64|nr:DUF4350 domain-containing protein [Fischerella sp. JS2]
MKASNRLIWLGAIAIAVLILLTIIAAPSNSKINSGSTYGLAPDGYGAWYAFMQDRGTTIKRWQKPFEQLKKEKRPVTLLQIYSQLNHPVLLSQEKEWVEAGNTLVVLGVRERVTAANFSTMQNSPFGNVKIATRRRLASISDQEKISLGDRFGAVVWEERRGKGKIIFSTTPYLAANAYQDYSSNFQYLASLVSQKGNLLLVDEYIHGYKDADVRKSEGERDLFSYLARTPLLPAFIQVCILLLVLIWAQNRRFGKPVALDTPELDNSEAYIQALAGVLHKAQSTDFLVEMIGKEEQLQLQKTLGLGSDLRDKQTLVNTWQQQIGTATAELHSVLQQSPKRRISERELISWLGKWQTLRRIKNNT